MSPNPESLLANESVKGAEAVGTRFKPSDETLAGYYLAGKVSGRSHGQIFQPIKEVDIYQHEPSQLSRFAHDFGDRNMYFFTTLPMENGSGTNFNRLAPGGCWEETENPIYVKDKDGKVFAAKTSLAYYKNDQNSGKPVKTQWLMKEYMLLEKQSNGEFRMLAPLRLCVVHLADNNKRSYYEDKNNQSSIPDYCQHNLVMSSAENADIPRKRRRHCSDLPGTGVAFDIPFADSDQSTDSDFHIPNHFLES